MTSFKSLKDHVYQYISEKINDGTLVPETKINEKMIVDDLGVSRTPVREAMIQLAAEGYLENIPRKGFVVKAVDKTKAKEVYGLLGILESYAASLAMDRLSEQDLGTMRQLHQQMDKALATEDMRTYYALQNRFHDSFIQKAGNQELIRVIRQLKKIFIRQSYTPDTSGACLTEAFRSVNDDHLYMIELFEQKDSDKLVRHLKELHWHPQNAEYDAF